MFVSHRKADEYIHDMLVGVSLLPYDDFLKLI